MNEPVLGDMYTDEHGATWIYAGTSGWRRVVEAEQEPVAWVSLDLWNSGNYWPDDCFSRRFTNDQVPLYAAPVDAKAIRAEALEEAAKVCDARSHRSDDMGAILAAAIRNLIK